MIHRRRCLETKIAAFRSHLKVAGVLLLFAVGDAPAQPIPGLLEIEDALAAASPELVEKRSALAAERKQLLDRTNRHNGKCSAVEEGSAAERQCAEAYAKLAAAINKHVEASKRYNAEHASATKKLVSAPEPAPDTNASVVDARDVPSGLPKGVQNAIDGAYANSPPGVSARVRRGFQAVMERDWKVAKAWFQDALNRDPANPDLKRLVALVDQPPAGNKAAAAPRRAPAPTRHTLTSLSAGADKMSTEQIMKALEEILEDQLDKSLLEMK